MPAPVDPPRPPDLPHELEPGDPALEDQGRNDGLLISEPEWAGRELRGVQFREVRIAGGDLSGAALHDCGFADAVIDRANLATLHAERATLMRVRLAGCRMTGVQWTESTLRDVIVEDCRMDLASLRFSRLERVLFRDCVMNGLDLYETSLTHVVFERCDLRETELRGARFNRSLLHDCHLEGIRGVEGLKGAALPWSDLVQLAGPMAAALGIETAE
jgi:uncharacterized protein YjbI with pentapeptide repeats